MEETRMRRDPEALGIDKRGQKSQIRTGNSQNSKENKVCKYGGDRRPQSLHSQVLCVMCTQLHVEARRQPWMLSFKHCPPAFEVGSLTGPELTK